MSKKFFDKIARFGEGRLSAQAPYDYGSHASDLGTNASYYAASVKAVKEEKGTLNVNYDAESRVKVFNEAAYTSELTSWMKKQGWCIEDIEYISSATEGYPYPAQAKVIFTDKEGILWRIPAASLKREMKEDMCVLGGVYEVWSGDVPLYVGKSLDLRSRLRVHLSDPTKFYTEDTRYKVTDVRVTQLPDCMMHIVEMQLIANLSPLFNKDSVPLNPLPYEITTPDSVTLAGWEKLYKLK